jgi:hypothetical protein
MKEKLTSRQHRLMDFLINNCVGKENGMQAPHILITLKEEYLPNASIRDILSGRISFRRNLVHDINALRKLKSRIRLICSDKVNGYYLPKSVEEASENFRKRREAILKSLKLVNSELKELNKNGLQRIIFSPHEKEIYQTVSSDLIIKN